MSRSAFLRSLGLLSLVAVGACAWGGEEDDVGADQQALRGAIAPTDSVGALPGSLSVDFDGRAHYAVPIEVPPARADHVPSLAFSYSSTDAIGSLGRGWDLSGLSSIGRCARSIPVDGVYRAVAYDRDDAFCLDGARLVWVGTVDGVDEYRTEQESFVRVFAFEDRDVSGPARWEVRRTDGSIATYGRGANSRAMLSDEPIAGSWLVATVRDRFGNLIEYGYDQHYPEDPDEEGTVWAERGALPEVTIRRIAYGSHESGLEATSEILFEHEERPDIREGFAAGLVWRQTRRLARVVIVAGIETKPFRVYHLDYETEGATGASRLVSLQDCVRAPYGPGATEIRDDLVCRPATTFDWDHGDLDAEGETWTRYWSYENQAEGAYFGAVNGLQSWMNQSPVFILDFDGDGADDIGYIVDNEVSILLSSRDFEDVVVHDNAIDISAEGRQYDVLDYNQDGRDDVGFFSTLSRQALNDLSYELTYVVALSTGDGISLVNTGIKRTFAWFHYYRGSQYWPLHTSEVGDDSYMSAADPNNPHTHNSFWRVADFTGDGQPDVLACEVLSRLRTRRDAVSQCKIGPEHFAWNSGGEGGIPAQCAGEFVIESLDANAPADRRLDVGTVCRNAHNPMLGVVVADFTGDGVSDLLYVDGLSTSIYAEGDGDSAELRALVPEPSATRRVDWDVTSDGPLTWKVLTFDRRLGETRLVLDTGIDARHHVAPSAMDINGDGVADIVTREDDTRVGNVLDGGVDTLLAFREGRSTRFVRHGWLSTGFQFLHVEPESLVPDASATAEAHSNVQFLQKGCRPGCSADAERYLWYFQADTCSDFDLDGRSDCLSDGVSLEESLSPERRDGRAWWWSEASGEPVQTVWWRPRADLGEPFAATSDFQGDRGLRVRTNEGHYGELERSPMVRTLDANGDGVPDLLTADARNRYPSEQRFPSRIKIAINHKGRYERITQVRDGMGKRTVVDYRPLSDESVYTADPTCDRADPTRVRCDVDARRVVYSVVTYGGSLPSQTRYHYWDSRTSTEGRGSLGFGKVAITDLATGRASTYRFDRRFDEETQAYFTTRRPVHVTHLVQGRNFKHAGDSSRTIGTELRFDYELHRHGETWSTVVAQQYVSHFEDLRYYPLEPYANEPFARLRPVHTATTAYIYRDDVPWSQRDLPSRITSAVDADRDRVREYSERTYEPEADIRPGDASTPWIVGRVRTERAWTEGDDCGTDVSTALVYDETHGGPVLITRQPDELAPPRSAADRLAQVVETEVKFDRYGNLRHSLERDLAGNERVTELHYEYDGAIFASAITNAAGHTVKAAYLPSLGVPFAIIDPNGNVDQTEYDGFGRVVGGRAATGDSYSVRFLRADGDPVPLRVLTETASGAVSATGFDALGRPVWSEWRELRDGEADTVRAERRYDAAGRVISESEPYFLDESARFWTYYRFDDVGTLRRVQSPAGTTTHRRTPDHRFSTDPSGAERELVLDGRGHVVMGIEPAPGGTIRHQYCADGRLRRTIDPEGHTTTLEYDPLGRRITMDEPDRGFSQFTYDAFDQLRFTEDAGGRGVKLHYDELGRLVAREEEAGETTWRYDTAEHGIGALGSTSSPDGVSTEYSYLPNGLLEKETLFADDRRLSLGYEYDDFGRVRVVASRALAAEYHYGAGLLSHITDGRTGRELWRDWSRTPRGDLAEEHFGNGAIGVRSYVDGTSLLRRQTLDTHERIQDWAYDHDANGRVLKRSERVVGFGEGYTYDALGRLVHVSSSHDGELELKYDAIGNLVWASDVGELGYSATNKPHAVRTFKEVEQLYDAVGNHLGDAFRRWVTYNPLDLPSTIHRHSDGRSLQIRYDAEGNRAVTHGPDGDRYYFGPLELRGKIWVHQVQVDGRTVAQAMREDGESKVELTYLHADRLGSTDLVTDERGNVVARFSYDAWGARRDRPWTRSPTGRDGTPAFDHGYTGHEHDDEWGVIHMRGRAYDPAMRRMTGVDPFVVNPFGVQSFNRYSYVLNDPINLIDPSGYTAKDPCGGQRCTIIHFGTGDTVYGEKGSPAPVSPNSPNTIEARSTADQAPGPNLDRLQIRSRDDALYSGFTVLRDWTAEINNRGQINVGGVVLPPHTAEGVAAQNVESFLGSLATVHDRQATAGEQAWGWLNIGLTMLGSVAAARALANAGAVNQVDDTARAIHTLVNSRFAARGGVQTAPIIRVGPRSISPSALTRTETVRSRANVTRLAESMKANGWNGPPIKVFEHNGTKYILDGHHRAAAARQAGIDVVYESVGMDTLRSYGYRSVDELIWSAAEAGGR